MPTPLLRPLVATVLATLMLGVAPQSARADAPAVPLRVGERLPALEGDFLSGKPAVLPDAARGKVALLLLGFTYDSRFAVEKWGKWFKTTFGGQPQVTYFEVPMMGRAARMGRFFIDRGMRKNTPKEAHGNVVTVYGDTGDWKVRMGVTDARENDAYLVLLDPDGVVRWRHSGGFDEAQAAGLKAAVEEVVGGK